MPGSHSTRASLRSALAHGFQPTEVASQPINFSKARVEWPRAKANGRRRGVLDSRTPTPTHNQSPIPYRHSAPLPSLLTQAYALLPTPDPRPPSRLHSPPSFRQPVHWGFDRPATAPARSHHRPRRPNHPPGSAELGPLDRTPRQFRRRPPTRGATQTLVASQEGIAGSGRLGHTQGPGAFEDSNRASANQSPLNRPDIKRLGLTPSEYESMPGSQLLDSHLRDSRRSLQDCASTYWISPLEHIFRDAKG